MLRVEALTKTYAVRHGTPVRAVQNISFEVAEHQILSLVGPSGCGKTTTLRLIAGLETPDAGSILLQGESIHALDPSRRGVALVFQNLALYPHLTVEQNIEFPLRTRGVSGASIRDRVAGAVELLGLSACLHRLPESISGGEQQRVALARAWVQSPRLLLLDEPFTGLDAPRRHELRLQVRSLLERSPMAVIQVTHDQSEAMAAGDRIAVMNAGRIEQCDTPERLYTTPASRFVARFIGNPPMNCIAGKRTAGGPSMEFQALNSSLRIPLPSTDTPAGKPASEVHLGIRAEHLQWTKAGEGLGLFEVRSVYWDGPGWIVHGRWAGESVWVRSTGDKPPIGSVHGLSISLENVCWFESASGRRCA